MTNLVWSRIFPFKVYWNFASHKKTHIKYLHFDEEKYICTARKLEVTLAVF